MIRQNPVLKNVFTAAISGCALMSTVSATAATPASKLIPNQYIVVLDKAALPASLAKLGLNDLVQSTLVQVGGGVVLSKYSTALTGFSARITANQAEALGKLPFVKLVEQDQVMSASATQSNATWGLDRVDQRNLPMDGLYIYRDQAAAGVNVYVIDTGLNASHTEFTGRVGTGRNFAPNSDGLIGGLIPGGILPINLGALDLGTGLFSGDTDPADTTDCNGHGTHVAGTATGTVYGVAKKATIHAVRVLGCSGSGSNAGVIAGVDWVAANAVKPAVGNMSLGGGDSPALDQAVENVIAKGISMAVAAGNDSSGACSGSPYKAPNAITVGSTDNGDGMSSFSNFGTCIDIFAPGGSITSASSSNNTGTAVLSGTSMASPHVAGAIALILGASPGANPAQVRSTLVGNATPGKVTSIGANTVNLLLYTAP
ncbi:MAG: S8 family peptidase [Stagnimonas sp.]|nr:S8 family peptidase [Stagnimonas sp.]